jgi:hypothetical protein
VLRLQAVKAVGAYAGDQVAADGDPVAVEGVGAVGVVSDLCF